MIDRLRERAKGLNISDFGIVRARVFDDLCLDLRTKNTSDFVNSNPEIRCNPFLIMPDAKSVIVCLFSYYNSECGNISSYAMGKDYHLVVKNLLENFSKPLLEEGFNCLYFCDSWDLNDRYLAVKAGLGFIGKNHMFISPEYGSFVFIGAILTDCELEESEPCRRVCLNCGECIKKCAGGALDKNGGFNEKKCVSYITQKKGELSEEESDAVKKSGMIWGCDICQRVCPFNKDVPFTKIKELKNDNIKDLYIDENMSAREFKRQYSDRAFSWRGIKPILRNQNILKEGKK